MRHEHRLRSWIKLIHLIDGLNHLQLGIPIAWHIAVNQCSLNHRSNTIKSTVSMYLPLQVCSSHWVLLVRWGHCHYNLFIDLKMQMSIAQVQFNFKRCTNIWSNGLLNGHGWTKKNTFFHVVPAYKMHSLPQWIKNRSWLNEKSEKKKLIRRSSSSCEWSTLNASSNADSLKKVLNQFG